jgi:hypothetical protein
MDHNVELAALNDFAHKLDPSAKVLIKDDSLLMRFLNFFARVFNKRFMGGYATTICNRVYIPRSWLGRDLQRLLVHEVEGHVRQCRWCGLGIHPWVGFPVYMLLYLLVFFPIGLSYFRYRFELGAEEKTWLWALANRQPVAEIRARSDNFALTVSSWDYFKPWPRAWVAKGFKRKLDKVLAGMGVAYNA